MLIWMSVSSPSISRLTSAVYEPLDRMDERGSMDSLIGRHSGTPVGLVQGLGFGGAAGIHYPAFHDFAAYQHLALNETPTAMAIAYRELTRPLYPTMTDEEVNLVIGAFSRALEKGRG